MTITTIKNHADVGNLNLAEISPAQLPRSTYHAILQSAQNFGDATAIEYILDGDCISEAQIPFAKKLIHRILMTFKGKSFANPHRKMSYKALAKNVTGLGNALHSLGITKTEVTSLVLPNFPETYVSLWAAEAAGIANPINPLLDESIMKEIMISANTKVIIALGPVPGSDIWQKVMAIKEHIPSLKAVISLFGDDIACSQNNKVPVYGFKKLLAAQNTQAANFTLPEQSDVCAYFHTGGTTGLPKLAKHLHLNQLTNAGQVNLLSPVNAGDTMLVGLPIFHVNAAVATGIASVMKGCKILLASPSGFRGKNIIQNLLTLINNYDVAVMTAVPTVYAAMVEQITSQKITVPPLKMKFAICGAAPLSSDLQALFTKLTNTPLVEGYGSTEGSSVSTLMPVNPINKEASVGLPIPGITLKIADINEQGTLVKMCDTLDVGEIIITGNNVFPGYVEDAHNQGAWVVDENGQQYFRTGDLGKIDENGYVSLCGRQKELIIRGGHNIDPKMIEDAATSHPDVTLAAAVPRPDSYAGEVPVLYVMLSPHSTLKLDDLTTYVSANIPERAAIPKATYIIDEIPLTAVGKIYKPELVCLEIKQTITEAINAHLKNKAVQINVFADKKLGIKANVFVNENEINELQPQIKALLTPFSFNYEVLAIKTITNEVA